MNAYRTRQTAVAFGLTAVGLVCGAWLIFKAFEEIYAGVRLPERGTR